MRKSAKKVVTNLKIHKKHQASSKTRRSNLNKKIVSLGLIVLMVVIGIVLFFMSFSSVDIFKFESNSSSADSLKIQAVKIIRSQPEQAKRLLEESREKYVADSNTNGMVDVDSLLYFIEHS